jgi:ATP-binding cassette subfamily B protein
VFELLDAAEQETESTTPKSLDRARGAVSFENVAFSYNPESPLFSDFSLAVEPGQTVAIVGPTGAGKTTLVNLLMRFYEVSAGRITIDGIDIRDLRRDNLRQQFGMVLQDTWLFTGTMRENIAYGALGEVDDSRIFEAARAAGVDHLIRSLPKGYDTVLTDESSSVSAGERQLLTIARAFIADPPILILDEATSSVDTRTERLVQQAMAHLRQGRTAFVIAHRLSTIKDADTILVMEHGSIVERGTHASLMAARGAYYNLYASQFAGGESH